MSSLAPLLTSSLTFFVPNSLTYFSSFTYSLVCFLSFSPIHLLTRLPSPILTHLIAGFLFPLTYSFTHLLPSLPCSVYLPHSLHSIYPILLTYSLIIHLLSRLFTFSSLTLARIHASSLLSYLVTRLLAVFIPYSRTRLNDCSLPLPPSHTCSLLAFSLPSFPSVTLLSRFPSCFQFSSLTYSSTYSLTHMLSLPLSYACSLACFLSPPLTHLQILLLSPSVECAFS